MSVAELNPFIERAKQRSRNPFIERYRRQQNPFQPLPDTPEGMLGLLENLSNEELREMLVANIELERRLAEFGPQDDDELHAWIKSELGFDIPRHSVCEDHDAPFDFIADLYFERCGAALAMANRSGGKTIIVAILHWINSLFKHGCESCTFGATEAQSLRCYAHLKGWIYDEKGDKKPMIISSLMRETIFRNGSSVEVLPGTPQAVNGPHPQKAHADEIELMDENTWQESRNMTISKVLPSGRTIIPQDICTSTRKGPNGRMQKLIDEIFDAINHGFDPPRKLYQWCIKETAAQVKNCQIANPHLGEESKCRCHKIRKGEWADRKDEFGKPLPRLLKDICGGDFFRSRGWQPYGDIAKQFTENDPETFTVQQLCLKPEMRWHYVPKFTEDKYNIRNYEPDPANGPLFTSTDWGGTNPHAVNWYQLLQFEIIVEAWSQTVPGMVVKKRLPEGTIVCFDEIYKAEIGNARLGLLVRFKESAYRRKWGQSWEIEERFADPQGKAARTDWKNMGMKTSWHITREFEEHIKVINDIFTQDLFAIDGQKCPMWVREVKQWRRNPNTGQQIDTFNHCMSNFRYAVANIRKLYPYEIDTPQANVPEVEEFERQAVVQISIRKDPEGPIGFSDPNVDEFARWRHSLGQPVRGMGTWPLP
jgi:hypothetical protein